MAIGESSPQQQVRMARPFIRSGNVRTGILLILDGATAAVSLWLATLLRFEGHIQPAYLAALPALAAVLVASRVISNILFKLHRWSFRFSGLTDGMRVALAGLLGTGLFMSGVYFVQAQGPPRSVVVMEFFLTTTVMGLVRFSPRLGWMYLADRTRTRKNGTLHTIIVGAGAAGEMLWRDLRRSHEHNYRVIGFVDDDRSKWGMILGSKPVLGGISDLRDLAKRHGVGMLLIAIPRLPAQRIREILSLCADLKVRFKLLPVSWVYLQERVSASMLQDLTPEDLLAREPISFSGSGRSVVVAGRRVMVTGAAGSIGSEICKQLASAGVASLLMVDINENGLYLLQRKLERDHPDVMATASVADIRDACRMQTLIVRFKPQDVFHAAAHKHVPLMEAAPCEAAKNNVLATWELAKTADICGAERFVFISTDKAVRPTSVMGASKRVAELAVRTVGSHSTTRFCAVRFGNVLGSAGSVVPLFREQISAGGPVTVTHPDVRRYFMTISEAVGLVLKAAYSDYGELCVLDMGEQIRIIDLAKHMITMAGLAPDVDIPIVFTGLRPGEKLFEELLTEDEESTSLVSNKIFVARSPAPPSDLEQRLEELAHAVRVEDHAQVVDVLHKLVPSYRSAPPPQNESAGRGAGEREAPVAAREDKVM
jgi:FlaA1/EpsC-like NDP-sugar epimerase